MPELERTGTAGNGARAASRRLVTVLFADVVGSTTIGAALDPERFAALQARMFASVRPVIERHGGTLEKFIGDAVMAVFGVPRLREDDALRAARAALELFDAVAPLDAQLRARAGIGFELRVGLHSGEVMVSGGPDALVSGDTVNVAARLQGLADPGTVLISADTATLLGPAAGVRWIGDVPVKGRPSPVVAAVLERLTGEDPRSRVGAPLVGRSAELAALASAFADAAAGRTRLVTLVGQAGAGKSRLVAEFVASLGETITVLRGRCLSYGDGVTWWALGGLLRSIAGVAEDAPVEAAMGALERSLAGAPDQQALLAVAGSLLGASTGAASTEDIGWAMRRMLAEAGRDRPVVAIVEDIHWAEPPLLDLLETLVEWDPDRGILLLCPARPELRDARPSWGTGSMGWTTLQLDLLDTEAASQLLRSLPGGASLPAPLATRILEAAEGNPLYLEEFVADLRERGRLVPTDAGWQVVGEAATVAVPATVAAVVAARIDGLPSPERHVAERGAVVGRAFERRAAAALVSEVEPSTYGAALLGLSRRAIVTPIPGDGPGTDAVRFRHVLLRDAAYDRIPKRERAGLHERFATWIEDRTQEEGDELAALVAHHLATAAELRLELDPLDDDAGPIIHRARAALQAAIGRAQRLHAWSEVGHLVDRLGRLDAAAGVDDPDRWLELTLVASAAEIDGGGPESAAARLERAADDPRSADPRLRARLLERIAMARRELGDEAGAFAALDAALDALPAEARQERAMVLATRARLQLVVPQDMQATIRDAEAALELAGDGDGERWYAGVLVTLATALGRTGDTTEWQELMARALVLSEAAGDVETILRVHGNSSVVHNAQGRWSDDAAELRRGIARADELGRSRSPAGLTLRYNAVSDALQQGKLEKAAAGLEELRELGAARRMGIQLLTNEGVLATLAGDDAEAQKRLDAAIELAERLGATSYIRDARGQRIVLDLLSGRREAVEAGIAALAGDGESADPRTEGGAAAIWAAASLAADDAVTARRRGDARAAEIAVERAARLAILGRTALDEWPIDRWSRCELILADGEHARAMGEGAAVRWRAIADRLDADASRWHAVYARVRWAEATAREHPGSAEAAAVGADATERARSLGAMGLVRLAQRLTDPD